MYNSAAEAIGAIAINAELISFIYEGTPSGYFCLEERPSSADDAASSECLAASQ